MNRHAVIWIVLSILALAFPAGAQDDNADLSRLLEMLDQAESVESPLVAPPSCPESQRRQVAADAENPLVTVSIDHYCLVDGIAGVDAEDGRQFLVLSGSLRNRSPDQGMSLPPAAQAIQALFDGRSLAGRSDLESLLSYEFAASPLPPYGSRKFLVAFDAPARDPSTLQAVHPAQAGILLLSLLGEAVSLDSPVAGPITLGPLTIALLAEGEADGTAVRAFDLVVRNSLAQPFGIGLEDTAQLIDRNGYVYVPQGGGEGGPQTEFLPDINMLTSLEFDLPDAAEPWGLVFFGDDGRSVLTLDDIPLDVPDALVAAGDDRRMTLSLLGVETSGSTVAIDLLAQLNHENPAASMNLDLSQVMELHDGEGGFSKALPSADAHGFSQAAFFVGQPARGTLLFDLPASPGPYRLLLPFAENPVELVVPSGLIRETVVVADAPAEEAADVDTTTLEEIDPEAIAQPVDDVTDAPVTVAEAGSFRFALQSFESLAASEGTDRLRLYLQIENLAHDTVFTFVPNDYLRLREAGSYLYLPEEGEESGFSTEVEFNSSDGVSGHADFLVPSEAGFLEAILLTEAGPIILPLDEPSAEPALPEPLAPAVVADIGNGIALTLEVYGEPSEETYALLPAPGDGQRLVLVDLSLGLQGGGPLTTLPIDPAATLQLVGPDGGHAPVRTSGLAHALGPFELWSGLSHRGVVAFHVPEGQQGDTYRISVAGLLEAEVPLRAEPETVTPDVLVLTLDGGALTPSDDAPEVEATVESATPETTTLSLPTVQPSADIPEGIELAKRIGVFDEDLDVTWNLMRDRFAPHVSGTDYPVYLGDGIYWDYQQYTQNALGESLILGIIEPIHVTNFNMKLWDDDDRFYQYTIDYSQDGENWTLLVDNSQGEHRGWQEFEVNAVAQYFRITGLHNTANDYFHLMEVEIAALRPLDLRRNLLSAGLGGAILDISPTVEGDDGRGYLNDGDSVSYAWRSLPGTPVEMTLGFAEDALLPVHAVLLYPASGNISPEETPRHVEVLATTGPLDGAYTSLGTFALEAAAGPQLLSFEPVWARHLKLRLLETWGSETFAINEIRVLEANQNTPAMQSDRLMAHAVEPTDVPYERDLAFYLLGGTFESMPPGDHGPIAPNDRDQTTAVVFPAAPDPGEFVVSFLGNRTTTIESLLFVLEANQDQGFLPGRVTIDVSTDTIEGPFTRTADVLFANTRKEQLITLPEPVEARFVKVGFSSPVEQGQITLLSMAIYESSDVAPEQSALRADFAGPEEIGPNIARDAHGGHVVSVTSVYEDWLPFNGLNALIDENALYPSGWRAADAPDVPQEIVVGFHDDQVARIAAVSLMPGAYNDTDPSWTIGREGPRHFEIYVSTSSPDSGWAQIGGIHELNNSPARQYFTLPEPVDARYVKIRLLDNYYGDWVFLGDLGIHEAPETGGYRSILADVPVNLADPRLGGGLIRYTSRYDASWNVDQLTDGTIETNGWFSLDATLPQRFVFGFDGLQTALINAVVIDPTVQSDGNYAPREVKIAFTAEEDPTTELETVGIFEIDASGRQVITFDEPVEARFLEVSVLTLHGNDGYTGIGEIEIHEAEREGYVPILARVPVVTDDADATSETETTLLVGDVDETEPNNTEREASGLEQGRAMLARIDPVGDLDVFGVDLGITDARYLNLTLEGAPFIKQYLSVQNGAGETIFAFDPREAGQSQSFTLPISPDEEYFIEVSEPTTSVVLVFDASGSMSGSVEALIEAADRYIADKEPHEEMAIVRFNHNVDVLSDFTTDSEALRYAVQGQLFSDGGTSVYAAMFQAIEMLQAREGNRAIVLLSDGADSGDGQNYPALWQALDDAGIRLFIVGLGNGLTNYSPATAASPDMTLQSWSWATGGEFFFAPGAGELLEVYSSVSEQLRGLSNYRLTVDVARGDGAVSVQETGERITGVTGPSRMVMIFDASNSMNGAITGLGPKIGVAKEVMRDIVHALPDDLQVGLRVYGHNISRHQKEASCNDTELVVPFGPLDRDGLLSAVAAITPQGQTPIGRSLRQLAADFGDTEGSKLVLLISDGIESCDEDPTSPNYPPRVIQELNDAGLEVVVNIVGFDITESSTREFLQGIAQMTGGQLYTADNSDELRGAIEQAMRAGFQVHDSLGNTVARGSVGAGPVLVPEGVFSVVIDSDPPIEMEDVAVVFEKETRLLVNKEGEELGTERELLDEISEAPVVVAAAPSIEFDLPDVVDPATTPTEPGTEDLARQIVREVQSLLNERGYDAGTADGLIGPRTREAIRHFQSDAGLSQTGEASTDVLEALRSYTGYASIREPEPQPEAVAPESETHVVVGVVTDFLDTSTMIVDGQIVTLAGIEQTNDPFIVGLLQEFLVDLDVICAESQVAGLNGYFCLDYYGVDMAEEMLRGGIARATWNAPANYLAAQDQARREGAGIW